MESVGSELDCKVHEKYKSLIVMSTMDSEVQRTTPILRNLRGQNPPSESQPPTDRRFAARSQQKSYSSFLKIFYSYQTAWYLDSRQSASVEDSSISQVGNCLRKISRNAA